MEDMKTSQYEEWARARGVYKMHIRKRTHAGEFMENKQAQYG